MIGASDYKQSTDCSEVTQDSVIEFVPCTVPAAGCAYCLFVESEVPAVAIKRLFGCQKWIDC